MKRGIKKAVEDADYLMKLGYGDENFETVPSNKSNYLKLKEEQGDDDSIRFIYPEEDPEEVRKNLKEDM